MSFWGYVFGMFGGGTVRPIVRREADGQTGDIGDEITPQSAMALSAVWACVNLLAGTQASLPLMLYRTGRDGQRTVASDHSLYRVLHDSPNADDTAMDFWENGCAALELNGNLHARIERSGAKVVALTPIHAPVTPRRVESGAIRYRWTEDGRAFDKGQDEVFHVRGFGGTALSGLSTLSYARRVLGLAVAVDKSAGATFANGLRPSGQIVSDKFLTIDQRNMIEERLVKRFSGAMNSGRPFISEGGLKWESIGINPEDAQMLESRGFSVEEICRFFGVPPFMIGHTEKSTSWGTGIEQQTLGFQKFTLRRRLKRIEQAIAKQLLTAEDRAAGVVAEFNLEGLLRADSVGRARFYQAMAGIGAMTINEIRALENLPPVAGGEVPRMQMQNVPITEATGVPEEQRP